jgi:uncharacterized membrane protein YccC
MMVSPGGRQLGPQRRFVGYSASSHSKSPCTRRLPALQESYWAPIAAVVVLYPDREATRKAAIERFIGTIVGSLVGWGCATWWHQSIVLYGLAIAVAVGTCYLMRLENASRLCAVAVTVIAVIPRPGPPYL